MYYIATPAGLVGPFPAYEARERAALLGFPIVRARDEDEDEEG